MAGIIPKTMQNNINFIFMYSLASDASFVIVSIVAIITSGVKSIPNVLLKNTIIIDIFHNIAKKNLVILGKFKIPA